MEFIRNKCRNVESKKFTVANYQNSPLYNTAFDAHIMNCDSTKQISKKISEWT